MKRYYDVTIFDTNLVSTVQYKAVAILITDDHQMVLRNENHDVVCVTLCNNDLLSIKERRVQC